MLRTKDLLTTQLNNGCKGLFSVNMKSFSPHEVIDFLRMLFVEPRRMSCRARGRLSFGLRLNISLKADLPSLKLMYATYSRVL